MKASELRIGNLVEHFEEGIVKVEILHKDMINFPECAHKPYSYFELDKYKPIPFTEEWLLRLGFVEVEKGKRLQHENTMLFELFKPSADMGFYRAGRFAPVENMWYQISGRLFYVHQLQNLYFALTREELTLKDVKA